MFISTQGRFRVVSGNPGDLVALDRDDKEVLWRHQKFRKYYDIEIIDSKRIAFIYLRPRDGTKLSYMFWRNKSIYKKMELPPDTHDIDIADDGDIWIADKYRDSIQKVSSPSGQVVEEYGFYRNQNINEINEIDVKDIDVFADGQNVLVSPRNYNQVQKINIKSKEVKWKLGSYRNTSILNGQHNPKIVSLNPVVVLVADSKNDRIAMYRKAGDSWILTYSYSKGLNWPRKAYFTGGGNMLIVDTGNHEIKIINSQRDCLAL